MSILVLEGEPLTDDERFADICERGLLARQARDDKSWLLGDLANESEECASISEFAKFIAYEPRTMQTMAQVSKLFDTGYRKAYDNLSWTHFKYASQFAKGDLDTALGMLEQAASGYMTCAEFYRHLSEARGNPRPLTLKQALELLTEALPLLPEGHEITSKIEAVVHGNH